MAEWLKALVLKVVDEPTNPVNTGVPLMFDIGVLLLQGYSDGRNFYEELPFDLQKIGWQLTIEKTI